MICYLLVPRPYLLRTPCLSINRVWERDLAWLAFWRRVGYQAYICTRLMSIVDIIALHSIAINNSWYTLVSLARRTCTTLNFNWTVNEGRMLEVRLSITIYM